MNTLQAPRILVVVGAVLALVLVNAWGASAAVRMPLDPTFGTFGTVITDVAGGDHEDEPFELLMQPDGKFVMPGKSFNSVTGSFDFTVLRHNPDGELDTTFGDDGVVTTDFLGGRDEALGLAIQGDGKLVAAGMITDPSTGSTDFGLARYSPDGTLDGSFGAAGIVITDFGGGQDLALRVAVQPDGNIVAAGTATVAGSGFDFALARYHSDGSMDDSFGTDGLVTMDFTGGQDAITGLEILSDGGILASGPAVNRFNGTTDFGIARYTSNGMRDASFGWSGIVLTDFSAGNDVPFTLLVEPTGRFLVAGLGYNPHTASNDMAIARYHSNGALDNTFHTYGKPGVSMTDLARGYDQILALAIQPDGKILGAGHSVIPGRGFDFAFVRYNTDGTLDETFGWGGRIAIDMFGGPDGLHGLVLTPDGKAVVAGDTFNPATGGDDFYLGRFLFADPDWIAGVVGQLPASAFASPEQQSAIIQELDTIESQIASQQTASAVAGLESLRSRMDGCGATPDGTDWIVSCPDQVQVRGLVDQLLGKLQ